MKAKEAIAMLQAAFPQKGDLSTETERLYVAKLADIPGEVLAEAINRLIDTETFFPPIATIRRMALEVAEVLPVSAEAALAIVRQADVREDIYRRDGSFAYTERYWNFPAGISASTMNAIQAAMSRCGDIVDREGKNQFGWEQGFKASYQTSAADLERTALTRLTQSSPPRLPTPIRPVLTHRPESQPVKEAALHVQGILRKWKEKEAGKPPGEPKDAA